MSLPKGLGMEYHAPAGGCSHGPMASAATVAEAMVRAPKTHNAALTVAQAREILADEHVHAVLVVDRGRLLAVVERDDLTAAAGEGLARHRGRLGGRVVGPEADLGAVREAMTGGRRRLAVVDERVRLLGLLCLKRRGRGFCSDADVAARAAARRRGEQ